MSLSAAEPFSSLQPAAATALAKAINDMEASAAVFTSTGMAFQLAGYLVEIIRSGKPDLNELRAHGLSQSLAVEIATAVAARHARRAAAVDAMKVLPPPAPKPLPPLPYAPTVTDADAWSAASAFHTIYEMAEGIAPVCLTELVRNNFSESTARELVKVITAARATNRTKKNG